MMAETQLAILFTSIALVVIGLYAAIFVDNIIKKIIGIMVLYRKYGTLSTSVMLADTSKQEEYNE